jgi:hypothetical protein
MGQAFNHPSISLTGTATLHFTLFNDPASSTSTPSFTDTLSAGLAVANPPAVSNTCFGTLTASPGSQSIELTAGSLDTGLTCTISVNVTGTIVGVQTSSSSGVTSPSFPPGPPSNAAITVAQNIPGTPAPPSVTLLGAGILALVGGTYWQSRRRSASREA